MSVSVQTCKIDGINYREFDKFVSGVDGCAKCICMATNVQCDVTKCQELATSRLKASTTAPSQSNDFTNIKDQIAKQYFSEYDPERLKVLFDKFGCKSINCPDLLAACNIDYNILSQAGKRYIGRGDRINKIVFHSTDNEAANSNPSQQVITTISYNMKSIQSSELTISTTKQTHSNGKVDIVVFKWEAAVTFTQQQVETRSETNETTIHFPSQRIHVDPFTKLNVTLDFFQ